MSMIDPTTYTDADLEALRVAVINEIHHREVMRTAEQQAHALSVAYHQAADRDIPEGEHAPWVQPTGAHDAYYLGQIRSHGGKLWRSLRDGNTEEPGKGSWREVTEDDAPALWVQPLGAHDAYTFGDRVLWPHPAPDGPLHVWLNEHPGERTNTWEPGTPNVAWLNEGPLDATPGEETPIEEPEPPVEEPDPDPDPDPDPEPEPTVIAWASGQAVEEGDLRTHDGRLWKAKLDHTTHSGWEPSAAAHAVWKDMGPA